MDGRTGIRFLLITILATAATGSYEFDAPYIRRFLVDLFYYKIELLNQITIINEDAVADWSVLNVDTTRDVHFQITEFTKSSGPYCGGGPAIIIGDDLLCLFKITFHTDTKDGREVMQYSMIFRRNVEPSEWMLVTSNVYAKTADYEETPFQSIFVEPISREHLVEARNKTPFKMNTLWLKRILETGFFFLNQKKAKEMVGNLMEDECLTVYFTLPLVMDAETVNEIVYLASLRH